MIKILILFAPQDDVLKDICENLGSHFDANQYQIKILSANKSSMPDLSAADIIILSSAKGKTKANHSDYNEIIRSAQGINFAGRTAGFLSFSSEGLFEKFSADFNDSEISIFPEVLDIDINSINKKALQNWAQGLEKFHRVKLNERI